MKLAITVDEAAKLSPFGRDMIYKFIKEDPSFPVCRFGKNYIIPVRAFEDWMCKMAQERKGL